MENGNPLLRLAKGDNVIAAHELCHQLPHLRAEKIASKEGIICFYSAFCCHENIKRPAICHSLQNNIGISCFGCSGGERPQDPVETDDLNELREDHIVTQCKET